MRRVTVIALFCMAIATQASANSSAYQAMQILQNQKPDANLHELLQISGQRGQAQPAVWTFSIDDPLSRGGVREYEIAEGMVLSERTPVQPQVRPDPDRFVDLSRLRVDSTQAFHIAEQEAVRGRVSFDSADYRLNGRGPGQSPQWQVLLHDINGNKVGEVILSAESGRVLDTPLMRQQPLGDLGPGPGPTPQPGSAPSRTSPDDPFVDRAGESVKRTFLGIGGSLQEFFTGRRTVDRNYRDD